LLDILSDTVTLVSAAPEPGLAESVANKLRLRNDLYCVQWGVKLYSLS